jgi:mannose-6-phosphate isomerase-like protein (cupin superfamily)
MAGLVRVEFDDVAARELANGGWSKLVIAEDRVSDNVACLGYGSFPPGSVTQSVKHETEELFFIVQGTGEVRLEDGSVPFSARDAFFVPAGTWHAVANTGDEDVVTVFTFPSRTYPPTEQREPPVR